MKQQIAAGILAVSRVGGVGAGVVAHQMRSDGDDPEPKAGPTATTTKKTATAKSPKTAGPGSSTGGGGAQTSAAPPKLPTVPVGSLRIVPGAVGPVLVGMSKQAAYATGYFDADVAVSACDVVNDLVWKPAYRDVVDVRTNDDGSVSSMGVSRPGPRTRSGLGVGSTYASVRGVLGDVQAVEAGYGQTGLFVTDGNGWIGFLFDVAPGAVTDSSPVTFIEVTRGARPGLMRDGC